MVRKGSPLIIGVGKEENFISSDINAILPHTKDVIFLDDGHCALVSKTDIQIKDKNNKAVSAKQEHINWNPSDSEKGGYEHFMMKEIHEQGAVVRKIMSKYVSKEGAIIFNKLDAVQLQSTSRFIIQACGTSWHAGMIGKYLIEKYAHIITEVDISSEFRYRRMLSNGNDVCLLYTSDAADDSLV